VRLHGFHDFSGTVYQGDRLSGEDDLYRGFGAETDKEKFIVNAGVGHRIFNVGVAVNAEDSEDAARLVVRAGRNRERLARKFRESDLSRLEQGLPSPTEMVAKDRRLAEEAWLLWHFLSHCRS
jgi:hypothetical protein